MGGERRVNCPWCGRRGKRPDTKRHLHINDAKNMAHCFRCQWGTRNAKDALAPYHIEVRPQKGYQPPAISRTEIRLPFEASADWAARDAAPALTYLQRRRFTLMELLRFDIRYCVTGRYAGRIVLPITMGGVLRSFQARDYTGKQDVKYIGPSGPRRSVLFNLDAARDNGCILLVEGIFDAMSIPQFGVAMLGKQLTEEQIALLTDRPRVPIILCVDQDAEAQRAVIEAQLPPIPGLLHHYSMQEGKDLNDTTEAERFRIRQLCESLRTRGFRDAG